jgi:hypothetical protein
MPSVASLGVIALVLTVAVIASMLRKKPDESASGD